MINSPVDKLRKFLELELKRGCDNRAVTGGLDKFLPFWQKESATMGIQPELNQTVTKFLMEYAGLDPESRQAAVNELLAQLPAPEKPVRDFNRPARPDRIAGRENQQQDGQERQ